MAATDNCSIFTSVSEGAFNKLVLNVRRQRPSLFNYGTAAFVANPELMCERIEVAAGLPNDQPRVGEQPLLPVPGTAGAWGFQYCAQLSDLRIDFHPGNQFALPPELNPLKAQRLALQVKVCVGLACPGDDLLQRIEEEVASTVRPIDPRSLLGDKPRPAAPVEIKPLPVVRGNIRCFCLSLFAVASFKATTDAFGKRLGLALEGVEIVDIQPEGLEGTLECLIETTLRLGLLPRLKVSIDDLIFKLGEFGKLKIGLTPISAKVPFNPSVANDRLSVFIDATAI